jgi:hypothetical protein
MRTSLRHPHVVTVALAAAAVLLGVGAAYAQEPESTGTTGSATAAPDSATVEVTLADGSVVFGQLLSQDAESVRLRLLSGDVIELRRDRLQGIRPLGGRIVDGKVWRPDPNATRLFFAPTGRSLGQGRGYFSVYELVVPFLAVGVTDRFSVAGGTPLVFGEEAERIFWLAPKLQVVRQGRVSAAVGALHFMSAGDSEGVGIAYGVATLGTADNAVTTGAGYGYAGGDFADRPVVMLGGEARASRSVKFITENYVLPGEGALVSGGIRFFGERLTADVGLVVPTAADETFAFPLVNFVYNW